MVSVVFTQKDLREFQKALVAIKSGRRVLLEEAGIDPNNLKYVVLSGSFGSSINVYDAIYLKIAPVDHREKVLVFGNTISTGLRIYVFDQEFHEEANKLLPKIIHVNLAEYKNYMNIWVKSLNLGMKYRIIASI